METEPLTTGERIWQTLEGIAGAIWVLVVLFVTLLALRDHISTQAIGLALIVPVMVAAFSGRAVALGMAVACALIFDVFFIHPYYSLTIANSEGWTAFVVYLLVAVAIAFIAGRLRNATEHEERRVTRRMELLAIAERLLRGEPAATVMEGRLSPLETALGMQLRLDTGPDGEVRCIPQGSPDGDQAATLEELDRLLAAAEGRDIPEAPTTAAFWDLG
jgi:two-component system, OmpR family, sensor histidine kinase KdpD